MLRGKCSVAWIAVLLAGLTCKGLPAQAVLEDGSWENLLDVVQLIRRAYVDRIDLTPLLPGAFGGLTDGLDPFSTFVPSQEIDNFNRTREIGSSYHGLIVLQERGVAYVAAAVPGGPGAQAQLRQGDILKSIEGQATRLMPRWKLQKILAAQPGSRLNLQVLRSGEERTAILELDDFDWPAPELREIEGAVLLSLSRIDSDVVQKIGSIFDDLNKRRVRNLLLDLRNCAWGSLEAAYEAASLFAAGPLGSLRKRAESIESYVGEKEPRWKGKVALLVGRSTLGPGEVLAGVLRLRLGAELIGERTFGYAGRRQWVRLSSGDGLWLTSAFYAGPNGVVFKQVLEPDLGVRSNRLSNASIAEDPVLRRALERIRDGS